MGETTTETSRTRRARRRPTTAWAWIAALVASGLVGASLSLGLLGSPRGGGAFAWFSATSTPPGWLRSTSPSGAVLSYPARFSPSEADPGAISLAVGGGARYEAYLNVTPRQGDEQLSGFASLRLEHLGDEATDVHTEGEGSGLRFHGGLGTCVEDDYRTRIGANHYREIACLVVGRAGGDVLVAAAPFSRWSAEAPTLERAVEAFVLAEA